MTKIKFNKRIFLIVLFFILVILSIVVGVVDHQQGFFANISLFVKGVFSGDERILTIFTKSRIPRTIAIVITAAGVSVAGLIMQTISRNKFVSPSTAGTTDAAVLGVLIGMLIFQEQTYLIKILFAFAFSLVSTALFMLILKKIKFKNVIYVPLIGLMYGAMISAISTFIAYRTDSLQFLNTISINGFSNKAAGTYELLYLIIPLFILAIIFATRFSIVGMGEDFAKNLGVRYGLVLTIGLIIIAVISSLSFVLAGTLPFVGLIIPNLVSYFYGDNVKRTIFDIALFGAVFVLINDVFSRIIVFPFEVTINLTMGVTGAIIFLFIIFRRMKHET